MIPSPQECWIDSLPDELISCILLITPPPNSKWTPERGCSDRNSRFLTMIQLVCRRWRLIACNTPGLWTFLAIRRGRPKDYRIHLKRSGTVLPLEVRLEANAPGDRDLLYTPRETSREVLRKRAQAIDLTVRQHTHRIQKLELSGLTPHDIYTCIKTMSTNLVNLRELWVYCGSTRGGRYPLDVMLPRLLKFSLDLYDLDWGHLPRAANLEELFLAGRLSSVRLNELAPAVRAYPHLRKLTIHVPNIERLMNPLRPVVLENLETLGLARLPVEGLIQILGLLSTPRLRELELSEGYPPASMSFAGRVPPLHLPELQKLTLKMLPRCALEIAKQVPSVRNLAFQAGGDSRAQAQGGTNRALKALFRHWRTLRAPLPPETFLTKDAVSATLYSLMESKYDGVVPLLSKISIHWMDTYLSSSEERFTTQSETRWWLSRTVELDVYGLSARARAAREKVRSWEDEKAWHREFFLQENMETLAYFRAMFGEN